MDKGQEELIRTLIDSVKDLSARVVHLEETINRGRGAFAAFLFMLTALGTIVGAIKFFWR